MSPDSDYRYRGGGTVRVTRKWIRRAYEVARIFARFNFGAVLHALDLDRFLPKTGPNRHPDIATAGLELPVRLRLALQELGVVGIKIGQSLSSRGDLLPLDYVLELRKLQDNVNPFPFAEVKRIVEMELKGEISELFADFEEEPAASASIGQVHYAVLPDGQRVVVKVQRPGIQDVVETELQITQWAAARAERYSRWCADVQIGDLAVEFAQNLRDELNYRLEAHNTERLRKHLQTEELAQVPQVYWGLSTRRVLTLERIEGTKPDDPAALTAAGINPRRAADNLARLMLRQIFLDGYFHGDPHPGNLLIQRGEHIAFLDCGSTVSIGHEIREGLVRLMAAVLQQDTTEIIDQILMIGVATEVTNMQRLRIDVDRLTSRYGSMSTGDVAVSEIIDSLMNVVFRHQIKMPAVFTGLMKALIVTEGVCLQLDPAFDFREAATSVAHEALRSRITATHIMDEASRFARDTTRYMSLLPRQMNQVLTRVQGPGLRIRVQNDDLDRHIRRIDGMFSRLSLGLVASAIIVGSALILSSERASALITRPVAVAYVAVGASLGGWLVYSIWRSGRL